MGDMRILSKYWKQNLRDLGTAIGGGILFAVAVVGFWWLAFKALHH